NVVTFNTTIDVPSAAFYGDADWSETMPPQDNTLKFADTNEGEPNSVDKLRVGGQLVIGGVPQPGLYITKIDTETKVVTFSGDLPDEVLEQMQDYIDYRADLLLPSELQQHLPSVPEPNF